MIPIVFMVDEPDRAPAPVYAEWPAVPRVGEEVQLYREPRMGSALASYVVRRVVWQQRIEEVGCSAHIFYRPVPGALVQIEVSPCPSA